MSDCRLSPVANTFSTILTAFVATIVNGASNGPVIAFFTLWLSYTSPVRLVLAVIYEFWSAIKMGTDYQSLETEANSSPLDQHDSGIESDEELPTYSSQPPSYQQATSSALSQSSSTPLTSKPSATKSSSRKHYSSPVQSLMDFISGNRAPKKAFAVNPHTSTTPRPLNRSLNALGWTTWVFTAVYMPLSATIFVCVHMLPSSPSASIGTEPLVLLTRTAATGMHAISLTFDTKARYGAALAARLRQPWIFLAFNLWTAMACLVLTAETIILLAGVASQGSFPGALLVIPAIFSLIFGLLSLKGAPVRDGCLIPRSANLLFMSIAGAAVGAVAGAIVAVPAFTAVQQASFYAGMSAWQREFFGWPKDVSGQSLGNFLQCGDATGWQKWAAVMP